MNENDKLQDTGGRPALGRMTTHKPTAPQGGGENSAPMPPAVPGPVTDEAVFPVMPPAASPVVEAAEDPAPARGHYLPRSGRPQLRLAMVPVDKADANAAGDDASGNDGREAGDYLDTLKLDDEQAPPSDTQKKKQKRNIILFWAAVAACLAVLGISIWQIVLIQRDKNAALAEYDDIASAVASTPAPITSTEEDGAALSISLAPDLSPEEERILSLQYAMQQNSDCVAWISIPDTPVNYPVVRGADNDEYLNRTFGGKSNPNGAIFMDYRNTGDWASGHTVIYGHNMNSGIMFGSLTKYLNNSYMKDHPEIILQTADSIFTYRIVQARVGDAWDAAYQMEFGSSEEFDLFAQTYGAPAGSSGLLTLSTCTNNDDDERLLVHAVLESVAPVQA